MGITHNTDCVNAIKPRVVAFLDLGEDEFIKTLRARLFHAFETEANVYGKGFVWDLCHRMNRDRRDGQSCRRWSVGMAGSPSHLIIVPTENGRTIYEVKEGDNRLVARHSGRK